jgi:hypothetical protein
MKRLVSMLAILALAIGAGIASPLGARAKSAAPVAMTSPPTLGSGLPVIAPGSKLVQAYWRYRRWHYRRWHYRRWHYYHRWHYRRWHYRRWHYYY